MVALITQLTLVTAIVIGFLLMVYYVLKQNPRLLQGFSLAALMPTPTHNDAGLVIESRLPLDARKSLMVIRAGSERYLIGATLDRIDAITRMGNLSHEGITATAQPLMADYGTPPSQQAFATTDNPELHSSQRPATTERPVGLSRFATPPGSTVTPAAANQPFSFQQQLIQVVQRDNASMANQAPATPMATSPMMPIPKRQPRGLNKLT